ncbi:hypothetical protein ACFQ7N_38675 [Streptomyces niveus]|uniref:hypothetical protein n=1 Tax=Streptomyces niveus TaxID=193462 RepID=UPI00367FED9F
MLDFRHLRAIRARRGTRRPHEPRTLMDDLLDEDSATETGQPVTRSSVEVSVLGVRVRSNGKSGLAALRAMRREHPVLVHCLYTYLSAMSLFLALVVAVTVGG